MDIATQSDIGALIRDRRHALGETKSGVHRAMSRSKFGRLVGVEGATVYQWEARGALPSHAQLCALVQKAGMDPVSLLGETGAVDLRAAGLAS